MKLPDLAVLNHKRSKASKIFFDFPFPRQPEVMLEFGRGTPTPVSPRAGFGVSFLMGRCTESARCRRSTLREAENQNDLRHDYLQLLLTAGPHISPIGAGAGRAVWHFERDPIPHALETEWPVGAQDSKLCI